MPPAPTAALNDTWTFDFETRSWTRMTPAVSPPPHHFATMAYHPLADRVVLFAGYDTWQDLVMNDTWFCDPRRHRWMEISRQGTTAGGV
jgi:hypothetical protein